METYMEGRDMFVENLDSQLGIKLAKKRTWQSIQNRVVKVLLDHRAYRNKQKKITGGGEDDDDRLETSAGRSPPDSTRTGLMLSPQHKRLAEPSPAPERASWWRLLWDQRPGGRPEVLSSSFPCFLSLITGC